MSLTLYIHPLASFCHKVLIALYENEVPFTAMTIDLADPGSASVLLEKWPVGKIPVLHDSARERTVAETSIIVEYLQQHYPGPVAMLPQDADAALDVRLWDRFFDLYVSVPMQKIVLDRIRPEDGRDPIGVAEARRSLDTAYAMIDAQLARRLWAAGDDFTMADCAAAPGLFFASIVHPFAAGQPNLAGYLERLLARPSIRRTLDEARPYFAMFPYRDAMPERFLNDAA
ncbi:glutathione S-transferase family protein [Aminobacter sp. HY435]|uniref:glutathione S-transferase family protein n=1 Tax=Aminobacter sp. HY435 TaxID=2970917 RepID=UPI0022B956D5|nr:glutathione S-transferase family protein [Aminobacter sp. HY435]